MGYNAVSLDDVIHLVDHDHTPEIRDRIAVFQEEYRVLFTILREAGLQIFLTQDVLSYTPEMRLRFGTGAEDASAFLRELVERCFLGFPEVAGLILRIGESDGLDVKGDFRSTVSPPASSPCGMPWMSSVSMPVPGVVCLGCVQVGRAGASDAPHGRGLVPDRSGTPLHRHPGAHTLSVLSQQECTVLLTRFHSVYRFREHIVLLTLLCAVLFL